MAEPMGHLQDRDRRRPLAAQRTARPRIGRLALLVTVGLTLLAALLATMAMLRTYPPSRPAASVHGPR